MRPQRVVADMDDQSGNGIQPNPIQRYEAQTTKINLQGSSLRRKFLAQADVSRIGGGGVDGSDVWDQSLSVISPGNTTYMGNSMMDKSAPRNRLGNF